MYGSQFHFEQTLAAKKFSTSTLATESHFSLPKIKGSKWIKLTVVLAGVTISTLTFASPSVPKITSSKILESLMR